MDYDSGPYAVTIPAGVTSVTFNISIYNDDTLEPNEDFMLTIDDSLLPTGVTGGTHGEATVTIMDNDRKHKICIAMQY